MGYFDLGPKGDTTLLRQQQAVTAGELFTLAYAFNNDPTLATALDQGGLTVGSAAISSLAASKLTAGTVPSGVDLVTAWNAGTGFNISKATAGNLGLGAGQNVGFFAATPAAQQASGANLTNNVASGGTTDQVSDYTIVDYTTDSATIKNNLYQLARKLKQVNDALRVYGLLS